MPGHITRPTYLSGQLPDDVTLKDLVQKSTSHPVAGAVGLTLLGVTAAYFAPRFFDWIGQRVRPADDEIEVDFES